jgi:hypothetical protein
MLYNLVYHCGTGEGPEPKTLQGGFDLVVTPGQTIETKSLELARALVIAFPQIRPLDNATRVALVADADTQAKLEAREARQGGLNLVVTPGEKIQTKSPELARAKQAKEAK